MIYYNLEEIGSDRCLNKHYKKMGWIYNKYKQYKNAMGHGTASISFM